VATPAADASERPFGPSVDRAFFERRFNLALPPLSLPSLPNSTVAGLRLSWARAELASGGFEDERRELARISGSAGGLVHAGSGSAAESIALVSVWPSGFLTPVQAATPRQECQQGIG